MMVWACIFSAVAVVAVLGSIIAVYDIQRAVADRSGDELKRLRNNAERSAGQIESQLQELEGSGEEPTLESIRDAIWLRRYWTRNLTLQPGRIYAAVTDREGIIVAHTRREEEGQKIDLPPGGEGGSLFEIELVPTTDEILTAGVRALDQRVPIVVNNVALGVYHTGLDAAWLEGQMADERRSRTTFWFTLVTGTSCVLLLSSVAVVGVTRRTARLEHQLEAANARRVSEMHELVLGIAHEIRNPLNAIRLNLHTVGQVFRDEAQLSDDEIGSMLEEMEGEIERLEALMREMLGFAKTGQKAAGPIDLGDEIQRTLTFLRPNLERQRIAVSLDLPDEPATVAMDAARLRQVLLNLVKNGAEAVGDGGRIEIGVRHVRGQVELTVADDGPGIPAENRERVFVPFFSTKASGTGLGLAVARKFVEEAGGTIACEDSEFHKGSRFRIALPAINPAAVEGVR
jgi:signal transduction histidine kinase